MDRYRATGLRMQLPFFLGLFGDAALRAGAAAQAANVADEGIAIAQETGEVFWLVPLLTLRAAVAHERGASDWRQTAREAVAAADKQGAEGLRQRAQALLDA